jgi:hypothetical protein
MKRCYKDLTSNLVFGDERYIVKYLVYLTRNKVPRDSPLVQILWLPPNLNWTPTEYSRTNGIR